MSEDEIVEVTAYPEHWLHLHGKAISGCRHSHPLRTGESRDAPDHHHEGDPAAETGEDGYVDQRGLGRAVYPVKEEDSDD